MKLKPSQKRFSLLFMPIRKAGLLLLLFACAQISSQAAFLNPTAVVFASAGETSAPAVIDDATLSDPTSPTATNDGSNKWTAPGSIRAEIVLDLGAKVDLTKINEPIVGYVVGQSGLMAGVSLDGSKITKTKE